MAGLPLVALRDLSDLSTPLTHRRYHLSNCATPTDIAALSSCHRVRAAAPSFSLSSLPFFSFPLLLSSCPAPLPCFGSHSCEWLVSLGLSPVTLTQWCFSCSSGKRVSMFVLFLLLPRLKCRRTKLSTGLAPFFRNL